MGSGGLRVTFCQTEKTLGRATNLQIEHPPAIAYEPVLCVRRLLLCFVYIFQTNLFYILYFLDIVVK